MARVKAGTNSSPRTSPKAASPATGSTSSSPFREKPGLKKKVLDFFKKNGLRKIRTLTFLFWKNICLKHYQQVLYKKATFLVTFYGFAGHKNNKTRFDHLNMWGKYMLVFTYLLSCRPDPRTPPPHPPRARRARRTRQSSGGSSPRFGRRTPRNTLK